MASQVTMCPATSSSCNSFCTAGISLDFSLISMWASARADDAPRPVGRASDKGYHALSAAPQVEDWRFAGRSIRRSTGSLLIRHDFVLAPSPARGHGKYYVYLVWGILIIPGTSTMTDPAAKKRIVIVGSGFGGMAAAN